MKTFYTLIGNNLAVDKWLLTFKDVIPQLPVMDDIPKAIVSNRWPLLFFEQIPERLLAKDPGFPVLLKKEVLDYDLPKWIYNPIVDIKKDYSHRYRIKSIKKKNPKKILFICYTNKLKNWGDLTQAHPGSDYYWIWLGDGDRPKLPLECEVTLLDVIHFRKNKFERVIDLDFNLFETYGIIHLLTLNYGAELDCGDITGQSLKGEKLKISNHWGSEFIIY